ncbi:MAG: cupin domain-containing protein [Thaumarchaeota archaeon]|nr:cupin domain-containing protein [Nitrososphaerota archaeon]
MRGSGFDLPKTVDVEELTIREADWGEMHVGLTICHQTLDIAPLLKGLPNDKCQCPHWGMVLKGRKLVKYVDHEEVLNGGDAYYMAPGHSTVTDAGTEWIEFSPIDELKKTNEAVQRNLAAMDQRE